MEYKCVCGHNEIEHDKYGMCDYVECPCVKYEYAE